MRIWRFVGVTLVFYAIGLLALLTSWGSPLPESTGGKVAFFLMGPLAALLFHGVWVEGLGGIIRGESAPSAEPQDPAERTRQNRRVLLSLFACVGLLVALVWALTQKN